MTDAALVTARDVKVTLAGRAVLRDISFSLSSGHLVALVGPNGAAGQCHLHVPRGDEGSVGHATPPESARRSRMIR